MNTAAVLPGRIGPNAITRVAEVLSGRLGTSATWDLFDQAGLLRHLRTPPTQMVDEADVRRLHGALREQLGAADAGEVARAAGRCTAHYLLAHRIPQPVQRLLRWLPAALAARVLLKAIARNAWTFTGSGEFSATLAPWFGGAGQPPMQLHIRHNPLCQGLHSSAPACDYYAATFERLFQVLVHPATRVQEVACEACGDAECRFELRWRA